MRRLDDLDADEVEAPSPSSSEAGRAELEREGLAAEAIEFVRQLDLRYVGQSFELTIPAGDDLLERFHAEHDRTYGFAAPEEPVEVVSLRLTSVGTIAKPPPRPLDAGGDAEPKERRPVYFAEAAATSTARSTTATRSRPARASPARRSSRSSTRPPSSIPASPCASTRSATCVIERETHERYGIVVSKDVMVQMRDGIRLATDLYRPARDGELVPGRWPTIVCMTPYDKTERRYMRDRRLLRPARLRGRAPGHPRPPPLRGHAETYFHSATPHTGEDGYDTIEWIAAQPWRTAARGRSAARTPGSRRSAPRSRARRT